MRSTLLAALATVGLVGCVGGIESGGGTDPLDSPDGDGNDNGRTTRPAATSPRRRHCFDSACSRPHDEVQHERVPLRVGDGNHPHPLRGDRCRARLAGRDELHRPGRQNYAASAAPILTMIKVGHPQGPELHDRRRGEDHDLAEQEVELRNGQPTQPVTPAPRLSRRRPSASSPKVRGPACSSPTSRREHGAGVGQPERPEQPAVRELPLERRRGLHRHPADEPVLTTWSRRRSTSSCSTSRVDLTGGAPMAKVIVNTASFKGVSEGARPAPRAPAVQLDEQPGYDGSEPVLHRHHGARERRSRACVTRSRSRTTRSGCY